MAARRRQSPAARTAAGGRAAEGEVPGLGRKASPHQIVVVDHLAAMQWGAKQRGWQAP